MPPEANADVQRLRKLEKLLDGQFTVTGVSFGIDSFIGRVPVVGDLTNGALPIVGDIFGIAFKSAPGTCACCSPIPRRARRRCAGKAYPSPGVD